MPVISRADASATIPEEVVDDIVNDLPTYSAAARQFRIVRMARGQDRVPVLDTLPVAYWVNGEASNDAGAPNDAGFKRTSRLAWANKTLIAEEGAVIIPVPIAVIEDSEFDLVEIARTHGAEALAELIDLAAIFGVGRRASWGLSVLETARAAGAEIEVGTATAAEGGVAEDYNQAFALVEASGYNPNLVIASTRHRAVLRGARDANGVRSADVTEGEVLGREVIYPAGGAFPADVQALVADRNQFILGIRRDVTADILTEASIYDPDTHELIYALAQQNMRAVRLSFRMGWQVAKTVRREQAGLDAATITPAAALVNAAPAEPEV